MSWTGVKLTDHVLHLISTQHDSQHPAFPKYVQALDCRSDDDGSKESDGACLKSYHAYGHILSHHRPRCHTTIPRRHRYSCDTGGRGPTFDPIASSRTVMYSSCLQLCSTTTSTTLPGLSLVRPVRPGSAAPIRGRLNTSSAAHPKALRPLGSP